MGDNVLTHERNVEIDRVSCSGRAIRASRMPPTRPLTSLANVRTKFADRATWGPAPYNEIAYASRSGPGFDIKVFDLSTGETRPLTYGEGSNESPTYSANGRHIAFTSTRKGNAQIFTMTRDGRDVRQITTTGNNTTPSWSK